MDGTLWAIVGLAAALLMRVGFALFGAGMVRAKNAVSITTRSIGDLCFAVIAYAVLGIAIDSSTTSFFGLRFDMLLDWSDPHGTSFIVGLAGVMIPAAIVTGALSERARFWPSLWCSVLLAGIVVPIARLWSRGWLADLGFIDVAGAATLHWTGALCGLVGTFFVGAREGKYHRDGSATAIPGHSVPLAGIGTFVLLTGWMLFVSASTHGMRWYETGLATCAAVNLTVAAAAGGAAALILSQVRYFKPDVHLICAGVLGALVAISAGAPFTNVLGALITGAIAGVLIPLALLTLDIRFHVDDPVGGIAIHGIGAVWGLISVPLLARTGEFGTRIKVFGVQILGVVSIGILAAGLSICLWLILRRTIRIRASDAQEFDGLDLAEHDIGAYPDFQQSMIKSYDLRQL